MPTLALSSPATMAPAAAGAIALLLWAAAAQVPGILWPARAGHVPRPLTQLASAPVWAYLVRLLDAVYATIFLALVLQRGYLTALHVGLIPFDWTQLAGWLPAVAGLTACWVAVLWGVGWAGQGWPADRRPWSLCGGLLGLPVLLVGHEAWAAILRGALVPALGIYWGAWAAALVRILATTLSPTARRRLGDAQTRPLVYLDWAMEWVAAGCFAASGSLWASLIARSAGHVAVGLTYALLWTWARRRTGGGGSPAAFARSLGDTEPPATE